MTTPNFGWPLIQTTDFVTDLPADFEAFADAVDADLDGLNGGTTGQVLIKNSATDYDFAFGTAPTGGLTELATGALTGATVSLTSISASFTNLILVLRDWFPDTNDRQAAIQFNADTGTNYYGFTVVGTSPNTISGPTMAANPQITIPASAVATNQKSFSQWIINDYANTTTGKTVFAQGSTQNSSSAKIVATNHAFWDNTSAINEITIKLNANSYSGGTYILYGAK